MQHAHTHAYKRTEIEFNVIELPIRSTSLLKRHKLTTLRILNKNVEFRGINYYINIYYGILVLKSR